jgi:hypothetical protein
VQQQQQQLDFAGLVAMRTFTVKRGVPANDTPSGRSNITSTTGSCSSSGSRYSHLERKIFKRGKNIV